MPPTPSPRKNGTTLLAVLAMLIAGGAAHGLVLNWSTVDGGGTTVSAGGGYRSGSTIGQPDAAVSTAEGVILVGGFWAISLARTAAPTPLPTASPTRTRTASPTPSATASSTPTGTHLMRSPTPTPTRTSPVPRTSTPTGRSTSTPSPTPTATATPTPPCAGDCGHDGQVTVDELVTLVNIALGLAPVHACDAGDADGNGQITINDIMLAVNHALSGCPAAAFDGDTGGTACPLDCPRQATQAPNDHDGRC